MPESLDTRLATLFGSETRLRVLAVLAGAPRPVTGYRLAVAAAVPFSKVYRELARLERAGLVARGPGGWRAADADVVRLLRKRVRVAWDGPWFTERQRRRRADRRLLDSLERRAPPPFPDRWTPRNPRTVTRPAAKDAILRRLGRAESSHG